MGNVYNFICYCCPSWCRCDKNENDETKGEDNINNNNNQEILPMSRINTSNQAPNNKISSANNNGYALYNIKHNSYLNNEKKSIEMTDINKKEINEKNYSEKSELLLLEKKLNEEKDFLNETKKELDKRKIELDKRENELNIREENIKNTEKNEHNLIDDSEGDLIDGKDNKKENIEQKENYLNKRNEKLVLKENDLNKRNEKLVLKENDLNQRDEKLVLKENDLNQRGEQLDLKENDLNKRGEELVLKENDLNKRGEELDLKLGELKLKMQNLDTKEKQLDLKKENLEYKEEDINTKEEQLKKKDEEFNIKCKKQEDLINEKNKELLEKNEIFINNENSLKQKESELDKKDEELKIKQTELEEKQSKFEKDKSELDEKQLKFEKEKSEIEEMQSKFKENQIEFEKQKLEFEENQSLLEERQSQLIENENKFTQEKLLQEQKLKQKEENLNKFKFSLEQEQKDFEVQKTKEELSKLPNLVGLQNIGATCYMNATLQALSNTNSLTEYFIDKSKFIPNNSNKKMTSEYYKVLSNLWSETKKNGDYAPYDFKQALSEENTLFAGIQANDSKDLINFLLERFHIELNNPKPNNNDNNIVNVNQMDEMQTLSAFISDYFNSNRSIITDSFYGIIETKSKCGGCQCTKFNFQIFSFLEFPLEQVNIYMYQMGRRFNMINQAPKNPDVDLYECFEYYQKIDVMNGQNQMYCNICNGNRDTFYGTTIYSLPNYLIINLNRGKGAVYECRVNFPEKLNLLNYASFKQGNTYFHLYAVICHLGPSSMSGHFVAYCKHRKNNKWYKYNDSFVTECTKDKQYNEGMPYILFYKAV